MSSETRDLVDRRNKAVATISRMAKECEVLQGIPLEDIHAHEVRIQMRQLDEATEAYKTACDRIISLKLEEEQDDSLETFTKEQSSASRVLFHLTNRVATANIVRAIELRLEDVEVASSMEDDHTHLEKEMTCIHDQIDGMRVVRSQPGSRTCPELKEAYDKVMGRYRKLQRNLHITPSEAKTSESKGETPVINVHAQRSLPLEIPKFDGTFASWKRWWKTFSAVIEENKPLTGYAKQCHFLGAMSTKEAREFALKNFDLKDSYEEAIVKIREHYEDCRMLHRRYHLEYYTSDTIHSSRKSLQAFSDKFKATHRALTQCKVTSSAQTLIMHALLHFDDRLLQQWKKQNKKLKATPEYEFMATFLEDQLECLGAEEEETTPVEDAYAVTPTKRASSRSATSTTTLQMRPEGQTLACPWCQGPHYIAFCPQYLEKPLSERLKYVRSAKLCFNCLGSSHRASDCRNPKRCKTCSGKHHTSIHDNNRSEGEEPGESEFIPDAQSNRVETHSGNIPPRLIKTAMVRIRAQDLEQGARAQFDSGSTISLIMSKLAHTLKAPIVPRSAARLAGINGARQPILSKHRVRVTLMGLQGEEIDICPQVIDTIAPTPCRLDLAKLRKLPFLRDVTLADPRYSSLARIDLLVDVESANACHTESVISGPSPGLKAYETIFGWTLSGGDTLQFSQEEPVILRAAPLEDPIQIFRDLLVLEEESDDTYTRDELEALSHFVNNVRRDECGRYYVSLPRRQPTVVLGKSRGTAFRRFLNTERALVAKEEWESFSRAVDDYLESGHSEEVPASDLRKPPAETFYLPMHGVRKDASTSTKLRVVFDASAKSGTGQSLNDTLLPGPSLHPLLPSVLTSFRSFEVAFSADISRMFRGIGLNPVEHDYHRYIHRRSDGEIMEMRHKRLVFGVTSSPFLANQVVRQVSVDHGSKYPLAAELVKVNYYVDDCLAGAQSVGRAFDMVTQSIGMMKEACLELRKWRSNSQELLDLIPADLRESSDLEIPSSPSDCSKALGLHWEPHRDVLYVAVPSLDLKLVATRREVASAIAKIFDVLGLYSPFILQARMILQETWDLTRHWDEELPEKLQKPWRCWLEGLPHLAQHPIPRYLGELGKRDYSIQLHGFADASFSAYGGVVYCRYFHEDLSVTVSLVSSRMRVTPKKGTPTIPRLELCAALLLAQLMSRVQGELHIPSESTYCWSDSSVTLGWLRRTPGELKTFVANRVEKIQKFTDIRHWRHVPGDVNPADMLSRGISAQELLASSLWWKGPPWLSLPTEEWPIRDDIDPEGDSNRDDELSEVKNVVHVVSAATEEFGKDSSSFDELVRSIAHMRRFFHKDNSKPHYITILEYLNARQWVLKHTQEFSYPQEYRLLSANKFLPKGNPLASLCPFLDAEGVMRVGGRLQKAGLRPAEAHPVILSVKSRVVQLFIVHLHQLLHHASSSTIMATMAVHYHVPTIKRFLRTLTKSCVRCRIHYAQVSRQQMGELPETRVRVARPFSIIGIDFVGPFKIKRGRVRDPAKLKSYVSVFICYVTHAVHLELVSELTTGAFLAALTRFVAKRGAPSRIETDNGSNFVGAEAELREARATLMQAEDWERISRWSALKGIVWEFTPVQSPQSGGYWEAAVGAMKEVLRKHLEPHYLDFEEFTTVLAEVEAILNSRPLVATDSPADDALEPLTPGHFLIGVPLTAIPFRHEEPTPIRLLHRWNLVKRLQHELWNRWRSEYLTKLHQRKKDQRPSPSLEVGDVVVEKNLGTFQRVWPLAVVVRVKPGTDDLVRMVDIRRPNGKIVCRGVRYLSRLFSESAGPDSDGGECSGQEPESSAEV